MRNRRVLPTATLAASLVAALTAALPARTGTPDPRELLRRVAQFTDADWAAVERGESVARVLETDTREVAIGGAVRITGSREALVDRFRDIDNLKRSSIVIDASRFSGTPQPSDLLRVSFEERSLDLRNCRPGNCPVRLGAADVARFHREVDWARADWRHESARVWREVLASYAAAYLAGGRKVLPEYVNKEEALSVASELALLLREYRFVADYSPEFHAYLQEFGPRAPTGAEQTLYWTKEDFGVRPILRISHQVIYRSAGNVPSSWIATNQVYADHYLDAAMSLTLAVDRISEGKGQTFYMIAINRARTRSLSGLLRRMVRSTVQSRSREAMRKVLTSTKLAIERQR